MKILWRIAILVLLVLIVVILYRFLWDYRDSERNFPIEQTTYREKVVVDTLSKYSEAGLSGEFKFADWDSVIISSGDSGSFLSAIVSKKGGSGSLAGPVKTTVKLIVDRVEVLRTSFEVAKAMGLKRQNYSGVVWFDGENVGGKNIETLVLGYAKELYFQELLILAIKVDDPEVEKVLLEVTYTKEPTGEDEDTGGGDGGTPFP